jgi:hypothetical protein
MYIPMGIALTEIIAEAQIPALISAPIPVCIWALEMPSWKPSPSPFFSNYSDSVIGFTIADQHMPAASHLKNKSSQKGV